jgi:FixJ family two-component response regulator
MIAVVDDDGPVRKAVVRLLLSAGYESRSFASGQELFDAWEARRPDCVVLDLQMPGVSGLEIQRRLRDAGERVPTIVITASEETSVLDECLAEGASACLRKPLDERVLLAAIERAVRTMH